MTHAYWQHHPHKTSPKRGIMQALTDIYQELDEVQEMLPLTRAEVFVGVFRHKMYFLPASTYLPVRGRWILPHDTVMVSFINSSALTALDTLSSCID